VENCHWQVLKIVKNFYTFSTINNPIPILLDSLQIFLRRVAIYVTYAQASFVEHQSFELSSFPGSEETHLPMRKNILEKPKVSISSRLEALEV
jgi:hypothetical protein